MVVESAIDRELAQLMANPSALGSVTDDTYKRLKEGIVSGREGTTYAELLVLSLLVPGAFVLRSALMGVLMNSGLLRALPTPTIMGMPWAKDGSARRVPCVSARGVAIFLVDWVCLCGLPLVAFALPQPEHVLAMALALVAAVGVLTLLNSCCCVRRSSSSSDPNAVAPLPLWSWTPPDADTAAQRVSSVGGRFKVCLTEYRTSILVMTVIAILAVDFPVLFPRRHVKTEHYGLSLMDVGVGAFIFSHALTSPHARPSDGNSQQQRVPLLTLLRRVVGSVSPMLVLGVARIAAVKGTDYQEHVSEYGVHWNFFFTLAAVALLSLMMGAFVDGSRYGVLGTLIATAYQCALSFGGLEHWILHADRSTSLAAANKEGLTSAVGYFALYLIGVRIGRLLNSYRPKQPRDGDDADPFAAVKHLQRWGWSVVAQLLAVAVVMGGVGFVAHTYLQPTSRKMLNVAYIASVLSINVVLLVTYLVCSLLLTRPVTWAGAAVGVADSKSDATVPPPSAGGALISAAVNANSLGVFLLANALTGLTNLSVRTLFAPLPLAAALMSAYLLAVMGVAVVFHLRGIRVSFGR